MRFASFDSSRLGVVLGNEVADITELIEGVAVGEAGPLQAFLDAGLGEASVSDEVLDRAPRLRLDQVELLAPIALPNKVIAAPVNYADHQVEMSTTLSIADFGIFLKAGTSVSGPMTPVDLPYSDKRIDQEGELGVVIGRRAHHVSADEALTYVFGYTNLIDVTVRSKEDRSMRKSYDTFTPLGPWVVTASEVADPNNLDLKCWVNDTLRQDSNTSQLLCNVESLIAYASSVMTLLPGDIIATGTPAGVGPLQDGDTITVEIEGLGRLQVGVTATNPVPFESAPITLAAAASS